MSHAQTLLILIHIQACQLIYFHLDSQGRKFGHVTKSVLELMALALLFFSSNLVAVLFFKPVVLTQGRQ